MNKTNALLACGIAAGPLFLAAWLIQALTRQGFDPAYHPLSLLSLGDFGWVQIANFVVTGLLLICCAVGMRRALRPGRAAKWGPILVGANGIGLIAAGVFVTDAGAGFPPGAPAGPPDHVSWHGVLHEVGFAIASLAWFIACFVFLRKFAALKRWGWVAACIAAPVTVVVVDGWPDLRSLSLRLVAGSAISFGFLAALGFALRVPPTTAKRSRDGLLAQANV
jgi:Protein of unknown function (DUF998)